MVEIFKIKVQLFKKDIKILAGIGKRVEEAEEIAQNVNIELDR